MIVAEVSNHSVTGYVAGEEKTYSMAYADDTFAPGDVAEITVGITGEISEAVIKVSATEVTDGMTGFYESYVNDSDKKIEEIYGFVYEEGTTTQGITYYDLCEYPFNENTDADNVDRLARVRTNKLQTDVMYVDMTRTTPYIEDVASLDDITAGSVDANGEGYFLYIKTVGGYITEAVIYLVDCTDFVLDMYQ